MEENSVLFQPWDWKIRFDGAVIITHKKRIHSPAVITFKSTRGFNAAMASFYRTPNLYHPQNFFIQINYSNSN